jgi:hypothetical protein
VLKMKLSSSVPCRAAPFLFGLFEFFSRLPIFLSRPEHAASAGTNRDKERIRKPVLILNRRRLYMCRHSMPLLVLLLLPLLLSLDITSKSRNSKLYDQKKRQRESIVVCWAGPEEGASTWMICAAPATPTDRQIFCQL